MRWVNVAFIPFILMYKCTMPRALQSINKAYAFDTFPSSSSDARLANMVAVGTSSALISSKLKIPHISSSPSFADTFEGLMLDRCVDTGILQLSWGKAAKRKEKPFYIDFTSKALQLRGTDEIISKSIYTP